MPPRCAASCDAIASSSFRQHGRRDPTTAKAILLLEATDRGMSAQDLDLALTSYARLQAETARRALGFYRTRTKSAAIPPALAANS